MERQVGESEVGEDGPAWAEAEAAGGLAVAVAVAVAVEVVALSMAGLVLIFVVLIVTTVNSQTPLEALESIAQFDELRCVPRLLCEMATGFRKSNFFGGDALLKLLSSDLAGVAELSSGASAMVVLGRAALLGVAARGNVAVCWNAYPSCPRDPDRLVHYLNNHRGGFFRFFGVRTGTGQLRLDDFNLQNGAFKFPYDNHVESDPQVFKFPPKKTVQSDPQTFKFPPKKSVESDQETFKFPPKKSVESDQETFKFPRGQVGDSKIRNSKKLRFPQDGLSRKRRFVMY